jgi:hypothetical protein
MPSPASKALLAAVVSGIVLAPGAQAIVIRDDMPDASYISLGGQSTYQATGEFDGGFGGTLIADPLGFDQYVITATHLFANGNVGLGTNFYIGGNTYTVAGYTEAPNYNATGVMENDLTIVRLNAPVTNVTPVAYYTGAAELNQTITIIGYGVTGNGNTGGDAAGGQRRGANNVIDVVDASTISSGLPSTSYLFDFDNPLGTSNSLGFAGSSPTALPLEGAIAGGDSGGGEFAVIGGTLYLVGVNSYITANTKYGDIDGATRVSDFSSFIAQTVPEPGSATLLLAGVGALTFLRRRARHSTP